MVALFKSYAVDLKDLKMKAGPPLGLGGYGTVYLADLDSASYFGQVAVKQLRSGSGDVEMDLKLACVNRASYF